MGGKRGGAAHIKLGVLLHQLGWRRPRLAPCWAFGPPVPALGSQSGPPGGYKVPNGSAGFVALINTERDGTLAARPHGKHGGRPSVFRFQTLGMRQAGKARHHLVGSSRVEKERRRPLRKCPVGLGKDVGRMGASCVLRPVFGAFWDSHNFLTDVMVPVPKSNSPIHSLVPREEATVETPPRAGHTQ